MPTITVGNSTTACAAVFNCASGIGASPPPRSPPVPERTRLALSPVPTARYLSCVSGCTLWYSSPHSTYSGSGMVDPVVTSTICVCARPSGDKIAKEIVSNMAVREKARPVQFFKDVIWPQIIEQELQFGDQQTLKSPVHSLIPLTGSGDLSTFLADALSALVRP